MKKFKDWYKDVAGIEPDYETRRDKILWCSERGLPVVVACTQCDCSMVIFSAYIDEEDNTYCPSCAGVE